MNDYPIAANAETIRLITFSASNRGGSEVSAAGGRTTGSIPTYVRATDNEYVHISSRVYDTVNVSALTHL